jgi:hypothetical protein
VPVVFCSQKLLLESLQTLNINTVVLRSLVRYLWLVVCRHLEVESLS